MLTMLLEIVCLFRSRCFMDRLCCFLVCDEYPSEDILSFFISSDILHEVWFLCHELEGLEQSCSLHSLPPVQLSTLQKFTVGGTLLPTCIKISIIACPIKSLHEFKIFGLLIVWYVVEMLSMDNTLALLRIENCWCCLYCRVHTCTIHSLLCNIYMCVVILYIIWKTENGEHQLTTSISRDTSHWCSYFWEMQFS